MLDCDLARQGSGNKDGQLGPGVADSIIFLRLAPRPSRSLWVRPVPLGGEEREERGRGGAAEGAWPGAGNEARAIKTSNVIVSFRLALRKHGGAAGSGSPSRHSQGSSLPARFISVNRLSPPRLTHCSC